jgi:hypothetical protein
MPQKHIFIPSSYKIQKRHTKKKEKEKRRAFEKKRIHVAAFLGHNKPGLKIHQYTMHIKYTVQMLQN